MNPVADEGEWRVNRYLLGVSSLVIGAVVVAVWPLKLTPFPWWADSAIHFAGGAAVALWLMALIPRRDDALALVAIAAVVLWEPLEWSYLICGVERDPVEIAALLRPVELVTGHVPTGAGDCTHESLRGWLSKDDTIKDIALGSAGSLIALIAVGRYD